MREYEEKTAPLIDYYSQRGLLHAVDSTGAREVVFGSIAEILEGP
jgi:adenylate kinase